MIDKLQHRWRVNSRREFFSRAGSGLAGLALGSMLAEDKAQGKDLLAPKPTHHPAGTRASAPPAWNQAKVEKSGIFAAPRLR